MVFVPARRAGLPPVSGHALLRSSESYVRNSYHDALLANENGEAGVKKTLLQVNVVIRKVLQGRLWQGAFTKSSYAADQRQVRAKILEVLE